MNERMNKVNDEIRDKIAEIVEEDVDFEPGVLGTIAGVETSADLRHAKIWVGAFPSEKREEVLRILNKNIYEIQGRLNKETKFRRTPRIAFVIDKSAEHVVKIEKLLREIKE